MGFNKRINIVPNNTALSLDTANLLKNKLIHLGYSVSDDFDLEAELIICIGGDGSLLRCLHQYNFPQIPIVGINTGHLGFLAEINPSEIDTFLDRYISGNYFIQEIYPVKARICARNDCVETVGVNEIVIKGNKSRTIHLDIWVNETLMQHFSGDGIIIATSTGSTAYNYSAGGSIVDPGLNVLQITPLAPINTNAYRSFTSSVILPANATIKINPEYQYENSIVIVSDVTEYRYDGIIEIILQLSNQSVHMLRQKDFEFWTRVIKKFL
jgi:NAD+ kinase